MAATHLRCVRLATRRDVPVPRTWSPPDAEPDDSVPFLTETPLEVDFDVQVGDEIMVGPHGLWRLRVTGRRLGTDSILIADGTLLNSEAHIRRHNSDVEYLLSHGWAPEIGRAIDPSSFHELIPEEPVQDPIEFTTIVARKLIAIHPDYSMVPPPLDVTVRHWAQLRGIEPAAAA